MRHLGLLQQQYGKGPLSGYSQIQNNFEKPTINYVIVGSNAENELTNIAATLNAFWDLISSTENGSPSIVLRYNTIKSNRTVNCEWNEANWKKTLSALMNKQTGYLSIGFYETRKKEPYHICYGEIEYINCKHEYKKEEYKRYEIVLSLPYIDYTLLSDKQKDMYTQTLICQFSSLSAHSAMVSLYGDYHANAWHNLVNTKETKMDEGTLIYGCHWINLLDHGLVEKLGGMESIYQNHGNAFMLKEISNKSGSNGLQIQLNKNIEQIEQSDLFLLRSLFQPCLRKAKRFYFLKSKEILQSLKKGTTAYKAEIERNNRFKFIAENILLLDDLDARWID